MAATTTIRLPPRLRARIHALARQTGHIVLYRFLIPQDEVRILAIRRQREIGFVP